MKVLALVIIGIPLIVLLYVAVGKLIRDLLKK